MESPQINMLLTPPLMSSEGTQGLLLCLTLLPILVSLDDTTSSLNNGCLGRCFSRNRYQQKKNVSFLIKKKQKNRGTIQRSTNPSAQMPSTQNSQPIKTSTLLSTCRLDIGPRNKKDFSQRVNLFRVDAICFLEKCSSSVFL